MSSLADIARLNVLIEVFSECANTSDLETLLRVAAGRLRWVIEFDRCTFALNRSEGLLCLIGTHAEETLHRVPHAELPGPEAALIERVVSSGAPAGDPPRGICVPLEVGGRTLGALCFWTDSGAYSYRDLRLGHHAGRYLGSLVSRLDLEDETKRLSNRKDDLLALLSHELRNPLAPIVTAVHLLKKRAVGEPTKELDIIERQAAHLVRLVDDLLDVARLTRGKMRIHRAPVELAEVVALAVEMVSPLVEERRHSLAIDVQDVGLIVNADKSRLAQVLSNLLSNAAHYTKAGGHVGVTARREGEFVMIDVHDDGIGIASDAIANIFDPFVQGSTRVGGQGGLGLGLVIVKQLTGLHGGTVSVASDGDGQGTKFTVRLPLSARSLTTPVSTASLSTPRTEIPRRVLLVDDNADALDLLSMFVEGAGHEVAIARDGSEALEVFERFHPSVAVIDINMPVMDGYDLAARLRLRTDRDPLALVALTGHGQPGDRERSRAAGFGEHLVKPVDLAQLLRVIGQSPVPSSTSESATS